MLSLTGRTDENAIIRGIQSGGRERPVYEKKLYAHFLYFVRQGMLKYRLPEEDAASAYSDTIITVISAIASGTFEGRSSLKSYTFQIFMNKCVDLVRKDTTKKNVVHQTASISSMVMELPDRARSAIQQLIAKNQRSLMWQKLEEIGEKCKQMLLLFEDNYSDKEIAALMNYSSADVVKTSRLRCIEKLKEKVAGSNSSYE
jgi:RNA polymerase sigma factor (sigma-70 family)